MVVAFWLCFSSPLSAAVCYCISQGLDAVDGMVARHFKQCSKYGAVLDMLTDRSVARRRESSARSERESASLCSQSRADSNSSHAYVVFAYVHVCVFSMSTAVLLIVLALQYQSMWGFFAFLIVLDIVSHWVQMVRTHNDTRVASTLARVHSLLPPLLSFSLGISHRRRLPLPPSAMASSLPSPPPWIAS